MESEPFRICEAKPEHAAGIRDIYASIVTETPISFEQEVPSVEDMAKRIKDIQENHTWLVCVHQNEVVAYAYSSSHRSRPAYRWTIEVTVYVAQEYKKMKLATRLYESLLSASAAKGYRTALAVITLPNEASLGFHRSLGFEHMADFKDIGYKFGRWHSTSWWRKELCEPSATVKDPFKPNEEGAII